MSSRDKYQILSSIENVILIIFSDSKISEWRREEIMATKDRYPETPRNLEACEGKIYTWRIWIFAPSHFIYTQVDTNNKSRNLTCHITQIRKKEKVTRIHRKILEPSTAFELKMYFDNWRLCYLHWMYF